jgi:transposase-like protein
LVVVNSIPNGKETTTMGKSRNRRTLEEKLKVLKECQASGASISEVCRQHGINTGQYYQWLKVAEEGMKQALNGSAQEKPSQREERLQRELERLKAVVVEITAENLELKKSLGE